MTATPATVVAWERAVRPLRRVLLLAPDRVATAAPSFVAACARLVAATRDVVLDEPLAVDAARLWDVLDGASEVDDDARRARLAEAVRLVRRLDDALGLPLASGPADRTEPDARSPRAEAKPPREGRPPREEKKKGDRRQAQAAEPATQAVAPTPAPPAPAAPAPVEEEEEDGSLLAGARWDTPLADLDLPDEWAAAAAALGLDTVWDALTLRPAGRDVLSPVHGAGRELPAGRVAVGGRVRARWSVLSPDGSRRSGLGLMGAGPLAVQWRRPFREADLLRLDPGAKVVLVGDARVEEGRDTVLADASLGRSAHGQCVVVRYDAGSHEDAITELIGALLEDVGQLEEPLPVRAQGSVGTLADAVVEVHGRGADDGRRRLAHDEALLAQVGALLSRDGGAERGVGNPILHTHTADLTRRELVADLDDAAQAAFEVIKRELRAATAMQRVLVGSADAAVDEVVLHAIVTVAETRHQVAVVVPEAPYATVLFDRWETHLRALGIVPVLAVGEVRRADRDALKRGDTHVVIGTLGALTSDVEWRRLGLVVGYEQARYGDMTTSWRSLRTPRPDLLVVSRTSVPGRCLLEAWPGLDVTVLEAPATPKVTSGRVWREAEREDAYRALADDVRAGKPGLIAYPFRRQGTDLFTPREAAAVVETLRSQIFAGATIALFHGATSEKDRQRAWSDFIERRAQVLVATVPIEWLPRSPRPLAALIEYADRVDVQRLLSLRAQTAGGTFHYVLGAEPDPARVAWVHALADGVSEPDLATRGAAWFLPGETARPAPTYAWRWLEPERDTALLAGARSEAHRLLREDPGLRQPHHHRLLRLGHLAWRRLAGELPSPFPESRAPSARRKRRKRRRR